MSITETLRHVDVSSIARWRYLKVGSLGKLSKRSVSLGLMVAGFCILFWSALYPWFFIPLGGNIVMIPMLMMVMSMLISNSMEQSIFSRRDFFLPLLLLAVCSFYMVIVNSMNLNGYINAFVRLIVMLAFLRLDKQYYGVLGDWLARSFGFLLVLSIPFYLYYQTGHSLPNTTIDMKDGFYIMQNHYLFVIDLYRMNDLIPRYQFVFAEPGYLGSGSVLILLMQIGKWKRWYNIAIMIGLLLSFSLTGYVLFVILCFARQYVRRRHFMRNLLMSVLLIGSLGTAAFFYDQGDNPIAVLILSRLEVDDGEMEGDNRVTDDFQNQYDAFLEKGNILIGEDMDYETFGNSGFRVFFFDYGLIGILLLLSFYISVFRGGEDRRLIAVAGLISLLLFVVYGMPLKYDILLSTTLFSQMNNDLRI